MGSMDSYGRGAGQRDLLAEDELDLRKYLRILFLHKWKIIGASLVCGAIAAAALLAPAPRYQAVATLGFDTGQPNLVEIKEVYEAGNRNRDYLITQTELIRSRQIVDRVIDKLDLLNSEEFDAEQTQETASTDAVQAPQSESREQGEAQVDPRRHRVATQFVRRLAVEYVRNTQLIKITFEAGSPEKAAQIANAIAHTYIESQREAKQDVTAQASSWLNERLDVLRSKLEVSEQALYDFQQKENLVDVEGVFSLAAQELNETTTQLLDARRQLQLATGIRNLVRTRGSDVQSLETLPKIQEHNAVQEIRRAEADAERRIEEFALRYGPKHPQMIAANSELISIRGRLYAEIGQIVEGIENEYQVALAQTHALERELARVKGEYQEISKKEIQHAELKRKVEIDRELYNTFLTRARETNETTGFDTPTARLADPAVPPQKPVAIKLQLFVVLAMGIGALLGAALAILFEMLYDGVRGPEDVESVLGQNLFGVIPEIDRAGKERIPLRTYFDADNYSFAEAIRTLRTSLVLSHLDQPAKVVSVTSSVPGEGKTTVSLCLAFSLAQMEKVLLIDADLRRPAVGRDFGISMKRPGLTNLLAGSKKLDECIYHDRQSGLDILPSGAVPPDAQKLLGSVGFANQVKLLAMRYDRIIIDTPPVQAVSDALIISRIADSTLYVIKSQATRKKVVRKGIERFAQTGTQVDGVVLSQVDLSSNSEYSSEYYGYYGDKYGYGAPDMSAAGGDEDTGDTQGPAHDTVAREVPQPIVESEVTEVSPERGEPRREIA